MVASAAIAICDIVGDGDNILLSVVDRMTIKTRNATVFKNEDDETNILSTPNRTEIGFKLLQDLTWDYRRPQAMYPLNYHFRLSYPHQFFSLDLLIFCVSLLSHVECLAVLEV
jgi:hypothetical protein